MGSQSAIWHYKGPRKKFDYLFGLNENSKHKTIFLSLHRDGVAHDLSEMPSSKLLNAHSFDLISLEHKQSIEILDGKFSVEAIDELGNTVDLPKLLPAIHKATITTQPLEWTSDIFETQETPYKTGLQIIKSVSHMLTLEQNYFEQEVKGVILQETVECYESGKMLADLRNSYVDLLTNTFGLLKSPYTQLLSQELLSRKCTVTNEEFVGCVQENCDAQLERIRIGEKLVKEYRTRYEHVRMSLEMNAKRSAVERNLWIATTKLLICQICHELKNHAGTEVGAFAQSTLALVKVTEKWQLIAQWLTDGINVFDSFLVERIHRPIDTVWLTTLIAFDKSLNDRDVICSDTFSKLRSCLRNVAIQTEKKQVNPGTLLDMMTSSLDEPIEIVSCCQDMFYGEPLLELEEKLNTLNKMHKDWLHLLAGCSIFHPVESDYSAEDVKATDVINQQIARFLQTSRVRLYGENGVAFYLNTLMAELESWNERGKQAIINRDTLLRISHLHEYELEQSLSEEKHRKFFELVDFEPVQLRLSCGRWIDLMNFAIGCVGSSEIYGKPASKLQNGQGCNVEMASRLEQTQTPSISDDYQFNVKENLVTGDVNASASCGTRLLNWVERMRISVYDAKQRRFERIQKVYAHCLEEIAQVLLRGEQMRESTVSLIPPAQRSFETKFREDEDEAVKTEEFVLTQDLTNMSKTILSRMVEENMDDFDSTTLNHYRVELFQELAEQWHKHSCSLKQMESGLRGSFRKRMAKARTLKRMSERSSVYRPTPKTGLFSYLQQTDHTIRKRPISDPKDGGQFQTRASEEGVRLPTDLLKTSVAYTGLELLNQYKRDVKSDERMACDTERKAENEELRLQQCQGEQAVLEKKIDVVLKELQQLKDSITERAKILSEHNELIV
ncbi:hypothetical protein EG68_02021 [Paragonimus skrjabini miyazakii]|uniref:Uncharacterized protein n=1 Tax=Paragonimus skrjabini miyazakii TaxID=59628 RepID=A0A8S9Z5G5_9TREM|nr:hypothetical protein EG68_02021 [Paragonimus skrjabini miyazakii]